MLNVWSLSVVALNLWVLTTEMAFCRIKRPTRRCPTRTPTRSDLQSSLGGHSCPGSIYADCGYAPKATCRAAADGIQADASKPEDLDPLPPSRGRHAPWKAPPDSRPETRTSRLLGREEPSGLF